MADAPTKISIRFHGRLNAFLKTRERGRRFEYEIAGRPGLLDVIQALGVPHPEAGEIHAGARKVTLRYRIREGDRISVRPRRDKARAKPSFILDVHLGRLARYLRLLGFDCLYENSYEDHRIVELAAQSGRIVLTRDVGLLKHCRIKKGYWLRSTVSTEQAREVLERFGAFRFVRPFSRCMACGGKLRNVEKKEVEGRLPSSAKQNHDRFRLCAACGKIYWQGSHYKRLGEVIHFVRGNEKTLIGPQTLEKAS